MSVVFSVEDVYVPPGADQSFNSRLASLRSRFSKPNKIIPVEAIVVIMASSSRSSDSAKNEPVVAVGVVTRIPVPTARIRYLELFKHVLARVLLAYLET